MNRSEQIIETLKELCEFPSPTGFAEPLADLIEKRLTELGLACRRTGKGALVCTLGGEGRPLVYSAHLDTLGAMVRAVKSNGRLRFAKIGGYPEHSVERSNCTIHTAHGTVCTGTVQHINPSSHAAKDAAAEVRTDKNLEIVVDEPVSNEDECRAHGIAPGDWISFDPGFVLTGSGYIKSRHLDDKAGVAVLLSLAEAAAEGTFLPGRRVSLFFSLHEEVGHGGSSGIDPDTEELIAVDMGVVGEDLGGTELRVSICAMDSRGPFDRNVLNGLVASAEAAGVEYAVDIYPFYGSDADAALSAGGDFRHGLIGPGVAASHGYERTHSKTLDALFSVLKRYAEKS